MGKGQSKDGGATVAPLVQDEDGKEYYFPDGSKSKYPFEDRPVLRSLDGDSSVSNL
jgi:hypothetical protein